ncbi:MAG: HAMP domain-containing protein [Burkholderiales bacterium]|nr:HAMP domain-containing protein [Burkholderiales bacterium]
MQPAEQHPRWHRRARHAFNHSLRLRLVALFLLLALGMTVAFLGGMQKALGIGWRDAARPLVADYVDRVVAEIGSPPSIERAAALARRLPISVRISGPQVNWQSGADSQADSWPRHGWGAAGHDGEREPSLLQRTTADGHRVQLGLSLAPLQDQPRRVGWITLAVLLALTGLAYAYVRRLLRPLDDIRIGARRFGSGDFTSPIPVRRRDELGQLATDVNAMADSIHQMLEAKRGLLLAISHELRSPLTRARVNTELLPETPEVLAQRQALLRDLAEMRDLVNDLLEGERLGQGHAALHLEAADLEVLAREAVEQQAAAGAAPAVQLEIEAGLPELALDRTRIRLLLRNLLDNAQRHAGSAALPVQLALLREGEGVSLTMRDHGPGVDEALLPHLAQPFYRPDAARERATGGAGLGLYLCRLVALAHGGTFSVRNAQPGLEVRVCFYLRPGS